MRNDLRLVFALPLGLKRLQHIAPRVATVTIPRNLGILT